MGKKLLLTFGLMLLLIGGFITLSPQKVEAAPKWCGVLANPANPQGDLINGRCIQNGQIYTALFGIGDHVAPYTTPSATLKANFISYINSKAVSPYYFQRAGAAFIKGGLDGGAGDWQTRLNEPNVTLAFETFNSCGRQWPNTAWDTASRRVVVDPVCATGSALVIRVSGTVYYAVKSDCGNPLGDLRVLPPKPPTPATWALTGTTAVSVAQAYPGASATFTHNIIKTGAAPASYDWHTCKGFFDVPTAPSVDCSANVPATGSVINLQNSYVLPASQMGKYLCERIKWNPDGPGGGLAWSQFKCVYIRPVVISCGAMTISPSTIDPYMKFDITVGASNSTGVPISGAQMTLSITSASGPGYSYTSPATNITDLSDPVTVTFAGLGPTNVAGRYNVSWTYTAPGGISKTCGAPADTNAKFLVVNIPHLNVKGSDIAAGVSLATDSTPCEAAPHITSAGIVSWNGDGKPDFGGAGVQYAAFAMSYIQDFVTGQGNGQVPAGQETSQLSLSNTTSVNPSIGLFGGMFGSVPCVDYWTKHPTVVTGVPSGPVGGWASGTYYVTGNTVLNTSVIPLGTHITLYVDSGNVSITGAGITYATGATTRGQLPSFKLIVHGVVYIDAGVSQLDGIYVAVPDTGYAANSGPGSRYGQFNNPLPGTISTCSSGFNSYDPSAILTKSMDTACSNRLTVNGSFVGLQIWLLRSFGSLGSRQPAEIFNYVPETWLAEGVGSSSSISDQGYQSIVGLPPIL